VIEITDLYKYFGTRRAIGPLSATIDQGQIVGLLGLNGAGKTTTLRILACDLLATSGSVRIDGTDVVEGQDSVRQRIGYLPDRPPLYDEMRVHEYLVFSARLRGLGGKELTERVGAVEELTTLAEYRDDVIAGLSHGFRQRVGIAQAIVHRPQLVVMDEPIAGLDPAQIVEMRKLVRSLGQDHTVVVSSHILSEISETCDRILVIRDGCVVASGSERELTEQLLRGMRIHVTARKPGASDPAREAAAKLSALAQVERAEPRPPAEMGEGIATLRVVASGDVRSEVAQALVGSGFELLELSRSTRELESVFLELSGAQTREPDATRESAHKEAPEA
jgi:ABC-2 type transport system ATP-binding protein